MSRKKSKYIAAMLTALVICLIFITGSGIGSKQHYAAEAQTEIQAAASPAAPTLTYDSFNRAIRYKWRCAPGTVLYLSRSGQTWEAIGQNHYDEISFPTFMEDVCNSYYIYAKAYDYTERVYSGTVSLQGILGLESNEYGVYPKCTYVGQIASHQTVPASYDQSVNRWKHGKNQNYKIGATIQYGDELADIEIGILWIGNNSANKKISDITFSVRTGPTYCSVKASKSVTNVLVLVGVTHR